MRRLTAVLVLLLAGCVTKTREVSHYQATGTVDGKPVVLTVQGEKAGEEVTKVDLGGIVQAAVAAAKGDFGGMLEAFGKDQQKSMDELRGQLSSDLGGKVSQQQQNIDKIAAAVGSVEQGQMDLGKLVQGGQAAYAETKDEIATIRDTVKAAQDGSLDYGHLAGGGGALASLTILVQQILARRKRERELEEERTREREERERERAQREREHDRAEAERRRAVEADERARRYAERIPPPDPVT
jgi:hypothetical protein